MVNFRTLRTTGLLLLLSVLCLLAVLQVRGPILHEETLFFGCIPSICQGEAERLDSGGFFFGNGAERDSPHFPRLHLFVANTCSRPYQFLQMYVWAEIQDPGSTKRYSTSHLWRCLQSLCRLHKAVLSGHRTGPLSRSRNW